MAMIEQSRQIFGLIAKPGNQSLFVGMVIKTVITSQRQEEAKQVPRGEKVVMNDLKYQSNYVQRLYDLYEIHGLNFWHNDKM